MATTSDIRNGMCLEFNGQLYTIVSFQHVKPGKGPAFVRTKLKNVTTGKVIENYTVEGQQGQKIWDTRRIKSGVYFYTFTANGISKSGKIVISK